LQIPNDSALDPLYLVVYGRAAVDLNVTISGDGSGTLSTSLGSCTASCSFVMGYGGGNSMDAIPNAGSAFDHWTGACSGIASTTCNVPANAAVVNAGLVFSIGHTLTVSITGSGSITSTPDGIGCPGDCTEV